MIFWYQYSSTSMKRRLHPVMPAAAVTTHTNPHAQQHLARDIEVGRAAVGQGRRPARCSEAIRSHVDGWVSGELQLCCCRATKKQGQSLRLARWKFQDGLGKNITMQTFFTFRTERYFGTRTAVQAWSGVFAAWCPQRQSRLMPSRTHSSNLHLI